MPTEQQENGSTDETSGQESQEQQQQGTTPETGANGGQQQQSEPQEPVKLPDDHPLVKSLGAYKGQIATLKSEMAELRAKSGQVTKLEEELGKRPTTEALETLQTRYDRLESFLLEAGGPISKALDSRTFTKDLFETDKDVADLVKDWHKANPSATSSALSTGAAGEAGKGKHDPNELIRAAFRGTK
ncbi:scaffolding protein [Microbacterium phage Knox]|uniref:Scaffolding protein n=7 Tax=Ilzatvirus teagan TaxID=2845595 RepID=A0A2R4A0C3_9CAUD|nr:scaffolding protein [Microbacterium phage AxiPup]AUX82966.1 scaffolding protein [Microbacterium phage Knox]AUX83281.1 scaffolding protein [Microbacterium phage Superfresh]AVR56422.1 scaffolding protein [Microbacterium phage Raptor]AVR56485.1 scaffolding protein [Microbacterium phage Robinson]QHB47236.1 scaffolding protein [Microbacterium phage Ioannes]QJD51594.1 scaffolding protein [Microbacterium phage Convict]QKY79248.1 scaffolding protein [Microbacterium phage BigRedClifford]UVK62609.